jgi:hypothetical protein
MKTTTHILFLIAIFLVSMVAEPAYAATPKKGKGKTKKKARPELTRAGNTYYINGKEEIKGQKVLEFYAQQNCQAAYDQYKRGRQCYIAGWSLFGGGAALTVAGLGCIIGGVAKTIGGVSQGVSQGDPNKITIYDQLMLAGGVLVGVGVVSQIVCAPLIVVGKKKMHQSAETYNASCRYSQMRMQPQPYWSLQTSANGVGFAFNF